MSLTGLLRHVKFSEVLYFVFKILETLSESHDYSNYSKNCIILYKRMCFIVINLIL